MLFEELQVEITSASDVGFLDTHRSSTDRNIIEKLFQTFTMRIDRFHETWNGSQDARSAG